MDDVSGCNISGNATHDRGDDDDVTFLPPGRQRAWEVVALVLLFFAYAGDAPPMVNEAHYLVKAKNFWDPQWCQNDLFAASGKAHTTFYVLMGWPTRFVSLEATAWIGRIVGWTMLAIGLESLSWHLLQRAFISLVVALIWIAGIEYGNLAGEWVIGGIEAKVPAYGLILLALAQLVQRHWSRVWILLGAASAFHVLSGGWSVIAAAVAWWFTERPREDACPLFTRSLWIGGAIALLGLVPAVALTFGTSAEDSVVAARIYTYYRIKHHLLPADFYPHWYLRHAMLVSLTVAIGYFYRGTSMRFRRLGWFTVGAGMIALTGLGVGMLPAVATDLAAKLLRYYWFRLADAMIPLMLAVLVARMFVDSRLRVRTMGIATLTIAVVLVASSSFHRASLGVPPSVSNDLLGRDVGAPPETQQQVHRDWMAVCRWVRASSDSDEVFLTPRHQQTFQWYAQRAQVVNWKDVPQDAASLREWYRRFQEIYPRRLGQIRVTISYAKLHQYRERFGVNFMVVDRRVAGASLPLHKVYPTQTETNQTYAVYELPRLDDSLGTPGTP